MVNLIKRPLDSKLNEWGEKKKHQPSYLKWTALRGSGQLLSPLWQWQGDGKNKIEMKMNILFNLYCIFVKDGDKTSN